MSTSKRSLAFFSPGLVLLGFGGSMSDEASAQIEFEIFQTLSTPSNVSGIVVADLNSDGRRDIVVSERLESVSLFEQRIDGTFARRGSLYEAAAGFSLLRGADLDLNGAPDLLWVAATPQTNGPPHVSYALHLFVNGGDGQRGQLHTLELGTRMPGGMAVGDLNGDRVPEIIIADGFWWETRAQVRVFARTGNTYVLQQTYVLQYNDVRDVVLGDVDQDGDVDLCALNLDTSNDSYYGFKIYGSQIEILSNDGDGLLVEGPHVDLIYGENRHDPLPLTLRAGDLDGDGDLDFALSAAQFYESGPMAVQMIESQSQGTVFVAHPPTALGSYVYKISSLTVADFDTDGDLDLITMSNSSNAWLLENRGRFSFDVTSVALQGAGSAPLTPADLDNDGDVDLVEAGGTGARVVLNITPFDGPMLENVTLKRGRDATLSVRDALPGERVYFLYSLEGAGNSRGLQRFGGITTDMAGTIYEAGNAIADADGTARLTVAIPNNAPLREVVLQAVIRRGPGGVDSIKTPFRTARITE